LFFHTGACVMVNAIWSTCSVVANSGEYPSTTCKVDYNEWGYSNKVVDLIEYMYSVDHKA